MVRASWLVIAGIVIAISSQSLIQDGMGLERWQVFEAAHWAPASRTVPEAIGLLVVAVVMVAISRPRRASILASVVGLRSCEKCQGPGPALWDDRDQRYRCGKCHSEPGDPFFRRN